MLCSTIAKQWPAFAAVLLCLLLACASPVCAQQPSTSSLSDVKVDLVGRQMQFIDVLAQLSRQLGRSIAMDGEPMLKAADFDWHGTAREALDKVGDVFDYKWKTGKQGVILLNKRFLNPAERPQMNFAEMRQMMRQGIELMQTVPCSYPSYWWTLQSQTLYDGFTPEQKERLDAGKFIPYTELPPAQQTYVWHIALNRRFGQLQQGFDSLQRSLDALPRSFMQIQRLRLVGPNYVPVSDKEPGELDLTWVHDGPDNSPFIVALYTIRKQSGSPQTAEKGQH